MNILDAHLDVFNKHNMNEDFVLQKRQSLPNDQLGDWIDIDKGKCRLYSAFGMTTASRLLSSGRDISRDKLILIIDKGKQVDFSNNRVVVNGDGWSHTVKIIGRLGPHSREIVVRYECETFNET